MPAPHPVPAPALVAGVLAGALAAALPAITAAGPVAAAPAGSAAGPEPRIVRSLPPSTTVDPDLEAALRRHLFDRPVDDGQGHGPDPGSDEERRARAVQADRRCRTAGPLRYEHTRFDLNGDGVPERIATLLGPYTCGTGGCELLIFRAVPGGLRKLTAMTLFRPPLLVADQRSRGWRDLLMPVRIDAGHGHWAVLAFDGRSYPTNPSVSPATPLRRALSATEILPRRNGLYSEQGQPLGCGG